MNPIIVWLAVMAAAVATIVFSVAACEAVCRLFDWIDARRK